MKNIGSIHHLRSWWIKKKESEAKPENKLKTYITTLQDTYEAKKMKHKAGKIHVKKSNKRKEEILLKPNDLKLEQ